MSTRNLSMYWTFSDGTRVKTTLPEKPHQCVVHLAMSHQRVAPRGYVSWDNGAANDWRDMTCTLILDESMATRFVGMMNNAKKGRGAAVTISLPTKSGFYPFGPDKGDGGDFGVRVTSFEHSQRLDEPQDYFRFTIGMVATSYPSYSLPTQRSEGDLQIGTISGLQYPQDGPQPIVEYGVSTQLAYDGTPYSLDKGETAYEVLLPMELNQTKAAALVNHLVAGIRDGSVTLTMPDNTYLFGPENGSSGAYSCRWLDTELTITQQYHDGFTVPLKFYYDAALNTTPRTARVFAVRIVSDQTLSGVSDASDIGLYLFSDYEFRWIDTDISGLSPTKTWKPGILLPGGIDTISEMVDIKVGGNLPVVSGGKLLAAATVNYGGTYTQLDKIFADNDIELRGCTIEIIEFTVTNGALDDADGTIRFRGVVDQPSWTETRYTIPYGTTQHKRRANLSTPIDSVTYQNSDSASRGEIVPVTIGTFLPERDADGNPIYEGYAKWVRTANEVEEWSFTEAPMPFGDEIRANILNNMIGRKMFPLETIYTTLAATVNNGDTTVQLVSSAGFSVGDIISQSLLDDKYITAINGNTVTVNNAYTGITTAPAVGSLVRVKSWSNTPNKIGLMLDQIVDNAYIYPIKWEKLSGAVWVEASDNEIIDLTSYFDDYSVEIIAGTGAGQIRDITAAQVQNTLLPDDVAGDSEYVKHMLVLTLSDAFQTQPVEEWRFSHDETVVGPSWARIIKVHREYRADVWPCRALLDSEANELSEQPYELYGYREQRVAKVGSEDTDANVIVKPARFWPIPSYAFTPSGNTNNNYLELLARMYSASTDEFDAFSIVPVGDVSPIAQESLRNSYFRKWPSCLGDNMSIYWPVQPTNTGLYAELYGAYLDTTLLPTTGYTAYILNGFELLTAQANSGQADVEVEDAGPFTAGDVVWVFDGAWGTGHGEECTIDSISDNTITMTANLSSTYTVGSSRVAFPIDPATGNPYTDWTKIDYTKATDKNAGTYVLYRNKATHAAKDQGLAYAVQATLPDLPDNTEWDSMHVGILALETPQNENASRRFAVCGSGWRGWVVPVMSFADHQDGEADRTAGYTTTRFCSLPDWYFTTNTPSTRSGYFWQQQTGAALLNEENWAGFQLYELDVDNITDYRRLEAVGVFWAQQATSGVSTRNFELHELAIIMRKKISVGEEIYSAMYGREYGGTYNDDWDSRKTAGDAILNPIDAIEHVCRLQNWSERGHNIDWGHTYDSSPLIDTGSSEGGFDYEDLNGHRDMRISMQLLRYDDCWTDNIIANLCREYFLVQYQDPATGNERIGYFADKSLTAPSTTITLSQILPGSLGAVSLPEARGIYCEPHIKYAYNRGSGKFEKEIRIMRSSAAAYSADYVVGLSGDTAELAWTRGHVLFDAYRQIEEPPKDMIECPTIYRDEDAELRLEMWFSWMGALNTDGTPSGVQHEPKKRIKFAVPYSTGAAWTLMQHHKLQLPHQTDDQAVEFVITAIERVMIPGEERIEVEVVLYSEVSEIATYIQDTTTAGTLISDWQDVDETQAEDATQGADVQDIM